MNTAQIKELPSYQKLIKRRSRVIWSISFGLFLTLISNLYLMSFGWELGSQTIGSSETFTIVVLSSIAVILIGSLSAVFYVWWTNRYLDPLINQVNDDIRQRM